MRREVHVFVLIFLDVLILFALLFAARANSVGVQVGNWAKYDISFVYAWSSQTEPEPSFLKEAQKRDWNNVTVKNIYGTNVTIEVVTHFKNDTKVIDIYQGNITTGEGNFSFPIIVRAGLSVGDPTIIHPEVSELPLINKTKFMNYAGATREVNFVPILQEEEGFRLASYFYYDRQTGILCESGILTTESTESYNVTYDLRFMMTETNVWIAEPSSGGEWWPAGVAGAVIVIVPAMIYYFSRRRKRHRKIARRSKKGR